MAAKLIIDGGEPLRGEIAPSAAKNAALPAMCAALLTGGTVTLDNVPQLADVVTMSALLERLGARVSRGAQGKTAVTATELASHEAPYELVSTMRASVLVLGPLLARSRAWPAWPCRAAAPSACARSTST